MEKNKVFPPYIPWDGVIETTPVATGEKDYFSSTIILFDFVSILILTWSFGLKGNCESL
jgi:hypothetical protein